jgi:N-acetylglucosamine-6-phosphate deacetylase
VKRALSRKGYDTRLLTEQGWLDDHQLRIEDGVITAIEPVPVGTARRDAELLVPAYIDIHVHGGAGVDVMDDAPDVFDRLAMHKAREGVGNWLPTTVTAPLQMIHRVLERIAQRCHSGCPGAQVLGSYLEGPYFTPQNKGAHPAAMKLCCCAKERVVLITDAMQAAGMPDGNYQLCGEKVEMRGGIVRTASGSLAGSTLSVDAAVRNMVELTGIAAEDAIHMASLHPARLLGIDSQLGSLKPGKRASIIALDDELHLQQIWIQGQLLLL